MNDGFPALGRDFVENEEALRIAADCDALGNDRVTGPLLAEAANTIRALVLRTPQGRTEMQVRLQHLVKSWRRARVIENHSGDIAGSQQHWDRADVFRACIEDLRRVADLEEEPLPLASPGFVVVPEEATEAMVRAGAWSMMRSAVAQSFRALWPWARREQEAGIRRLWRAMVAMRPREDGPVAPEVREY